MQIMGVMKVAWVTGPASLAFAQKFLPAETWVPFFSFVNFVLGRFTSFVPSIPSFLASLALGGTSGGHLSCNDTDPCRHW